MPMPIPSVECNVSADQSLSSSSFGDPNAQPPTPQQTPSSAVFPSPVFETPKNNQSSFSDSGNWTPRFAEDYSVFNSTPGNLRGTQGPFDDFVSAAPAAPPTGHKRLLSAEGLAAEIAAHANHFSPNPNARLPPVDPARRLPSSPSVVNTPQECRADPEVQQTPNLSRARSSKKVRRGTVQELEVTQTITPPPSAHKGGRKLAPKLKMQNDQGFGQPDFTGASQHHDMQALMGNPEDVFSYPLSAPVTAPNFWDPSMAMSMDLDFAANGAALFQNAAPGSHRLQQAFGWNGDLPMFQDPLAAPIPANHENMNFMRRERTLAPRPAESGQVSAPADPMQAGSFSAQPMGDPFGIVHPGDAVDPGLLFSRPQTSAMEASFNASDQISTLEGGSSESRGQGAGDGRRRASVKDAKSGKMPDRAFASSPIKTSARPGLGRSFSENRGKKALGRGSVAPVAPVARGGNSGSGAEASGRPTARSSGRSSPLKSQHRASELASIPESLSQPCARTSVKFTIDSRGRARAETTMMSGDFDADRGILRSHSSRDLSRQRSWDPSEDDESTDDEPIIIPSRNTSFNASFALPDPRKPVGSIFHSSRRSISDKSTSTSATADSLNAPLHEGESEAETVMNERIDNGGDAASELRKVVQDRQKRSAQMSSSKSQRLLAAPLRGMYGGAISPSLTEVSHGSDTHVVRCVCNKNGASEQDGFMVQCESCEMWLHGRCINITRRSMPRVYICGFCANTPNARGGRGRDLRRSSTLGVGSALSPLAGKSLRSFR